MQGSKRVSFETNQFSARNCGEVVFTRIFSSVIFSTSSTITSSLGRLEHALSLLGANEGSSEGNADGSAIIGDADG